jgi:hypothetical protein
MFTVLSKVEKDILYTHSLLSIEEEEKEEEAAEDCFRKSDQA